MHFHTAYTRTGKINAPSYITSIATIRQRPDKLQTLFYIAALLWPCAIHYQLSLCVLRLSELLCPGVSSGMYVCVPVQNQILQDIEILTESIQSQG